MLKQQKHIYTKPHVLTISFYLSKTICNCRIYLRSLKTPLRKCFPIKLELKNSKINEYNMKENHKDERNRYIYNKPDEIL